MKIIFTTLCFAVALSTSVFAQQNTRFVDGGNTWYAFGQFYDILSGAEQNLHKTNYFSGDTILNNLTYKKMFVHILDTTYYRENGEIIQTTNRPPKTRYEGAFREQDATVYFVLPSDSTEKIYMNFNMQIGDSIKAHYYATNSQSTVSSIISTPFGSTTRKEFVLSNGYSFYEGIGNGLGLFHGFGIGHHGGIYLVCFQQNGVQVNTHQFSWPSPDCSPSVTPSSVGLKQHQLADFKIYPTPFSNAFNIDFKGEIDKSYVLKMYDVKGTCVKTIRYLNTKHHVITRDNLEAGIYFIKIISDNKQLVYYNKIIAI
jgi:hypothetical protein